MISVAICEDDLQEIDKVKALLEKYNHKIAQCNFKINSFRSSLEFITYIYNFGGFGINYINTFMPGMLGNEVARELRHTGYAGEIIFLTNSLDYTLNAFELNGLQYLVKPYDECSFFATTDKAVRRICAEKKEILTLKTTNGIACIRLRDIIFTETGRKNYQNIHTVGMKPVEVRMTSLELFELISHSKSFVRCGASLILNMKFISHISKENIIFNTGQQISYPYRSYRKLKEDFLRFYISTEE